MEITDDAFVNMVTDSLKSRRPCVQRPFPVLIDGKELDLLLLYHKVKDLGGYGSTSSDGKWGDISTLLGLGPRCGPSVKLVYLKYLKPLLCTFKPDQNADEENGQKKRKRDEKESPSAKKAFPDFKESLDWLTSLAIAPGDPIHSAHNPKFQHTLKRIRTLLADDKPFRRRATKYSLRPSKSVLVKNIRGPKAGPSQNGAPANVGSEFQAEVPDKPLPQTERDESLVYLGKVVWPLQARDVENVKPRSSRTMRCNCLDKGSVACVQLHVEEMRKVVEAEIGQETFKGWGFDRMGERVAQTWSIREQKKFKSVFVRCRYADEGAKTVWSELHRAFPDRSRSELVSFYFNVFMLRRRAIQNRTGMEPDSDDDENELDDENPSFGYYKETNNIIILD